MGEWEHTEPGWYTHPEQGGVCLEDDNRWWHYPLDTDRRYGSYKTAKACIADIAHNQPEVSNGD